MLTLRTTSGPQPLGVLLIEGARRDQSTSDSLPQLADEIQELYDWVAANFISPILTSDEATFNDVCDRLWKPYLVVYTGLIEYLRPVLEKARLLMADEQGETELERLINEKAPEVLGPDLTLQLRISLHTYKLIGQAFLRSFEAGLLDPKKLTPESGLGAEDMKSFILTELMLWSLFHVLYKNKVEPPPGHETLSRIVATARGNIGRNYAFAKRLGILGPVRLPVPERFEADEEREALADAGLDDYAEMLE